MSDEPLLREYIEPRDRRTIFNLLTSVGFFQPREIAYGMDLLDEHLLKGERSTYRFMLYEHDGQLLGYGCYGPLRLTDRHYHLHWMAVSTAHQHKGLGHKLEQVITAKATEAGAIRMFAEMSSRESHATSRAFYETCGYRAVANVADYYSTGDNMLLYMKELGALAKG